MPQQVPTAAWIGIAAAAAMVIGSFGPWAKALFVSVSGTDGSNDGWLVVAAAIIGGLAVIAYARRVRVAPMVIATLAGAAGAATTIYDRNSLTSADDDSEFEGIVQVGWGLNLAMGASIALALVGLITIVRHLDKHGWKRTPVDVAAAPEKAEAPPSPPE